MSFPENNENNKLRRKPLAISLISGGLDSILAVKLIQKQGFRVHGYQFITPFFHWDKVGREREEARLLLEKYGIEVTILPIWPVYLDIVRNPRFGYGKNMNPCLDCKIFMLRKAAEIMKKKGAHFVFTGEVLGQRPMSQRRDALHRIENESGLKGRLVRPLSAKLLPPSIPEENGLLNREALMGISGRSRKAQMELARDLNIYDYPSPAGGCLLTDPNYSRLLKNLLASESCPSTNDVELLSLGRHFNIGSGGRLTIGRNEKENRKISSLAGENDLLLETVDIPGPVSVLTGTFDEEEVTTAARITARYSDHEGMENVIIGFSHFNHRGRISVSPADPEEIEGLRI